jgi:arsenate reductase
VLIDIHQISYIDVCQLIRSLSMSNVLFVCLHNAGRSQMSESFFDASTKGGPHECRSAGTAPADKIHPVVVEAMAEAGLDLSDHKPKQLTTEMAEWADVVVTMGCGDECPYVPGTRYIDWVLEDPATQNLAAVRATRDEIQMRIGNLIAQLDEEAGG